MKMPMDPLPEEGLEGGASGDNEEEGGVEIDIMERKPQSKEKKKRRHKKMHKQRENSHQQQAHTWVGASVGLKSLRSARKKRDKAKDSATSTLGVAPTAPTSMTSFKQQHGTALMAAI